MIIYTLISDQQLIVQKFTKASETGSKKPQNEELPVWVNLHWFWHTFGMTYMAFVGQTADPWDVPVKQLIQVM
jgi:hypothetical protein